jgi:hypothetical protein
MICPITGEAHTAPQGAQSRVGWDAVGQLSLPKQLGRLCLLYTNIISIGRILFSWLDEFILPWPPLIIRIESRTLCALRLSLPELLRARNRKAGTTSKLKLYTKQTLRSPLFPLSHILSASNGSAGSVSAISCTAESFGSSL